MVRFLDWLFRNRHTGRITLGQFPNLPMLLFGTGYAIEWLARPGGRTGLFVWAATRACLAWWAADELLRGVNPWRRMLGAGVLVYLGISLLWRG